MQFTCTWEDFEHQVPFYTRRGQTTCRRPKVSEEILGEIGARLATSPRKWVVRLVQQAGLFGATTRNATKPMHLHPYKKSVVHELHDAAPEAELYCVIWYVHVVHVEEIDFTFFIFRAEAWFQLSGYVKSQTNKQKIPP